MNNIHRIVMRHTVKHVIRMDTGGNQVTIRQLSRPRIHVVSVGVQGPVGTVAESVLTMAQEVQAAAQKATNTATQAMTDQSDMVTGMTLTLDHYIGAIEAQE
ncbi:hypothetical protein P7M54_24600 [Vibrio parahaemolyticus]|nr:hypothetical protein [Vibrio parahaemolyticus]